MSEGTAREVEDGVAEVRMIKDIKHLAPELKIESLRELCIFGDREVGVEEARTGNRVAPQTAWVTSTGNYWIDIAAGLRWYIAERARDRKDRTRSRGAVRNHRVGSLKGPVEALADYGGAEKLTRIAGGRSLG